MNDRVIYLDNNATTQPAPEVLEAMQPFLTQQWGNPSSMHAFGGRTAKHIARAREQAAMLLGADASEIIFTSCGTESDNTAIRGAAEAAGKTLTLITSRVEHPAVLEPCRALKRMGHNLVELEVDSGGRLQLDALRAALNLGPALVSLMWANNETGVIFPMEEIAEIVKGAGGALHTDAVQIVGKRPLDLRRVPVDLLSFSGHKIHAPKGIGALYIRRGTKLQPFMLGGHQESGKRGGTENVPGIVALGCACELAATHMNEEMTRVARLRDKLEKGLLAACANVQINGDPAQRLPNTSNLSFQFIEGEAILYHMSDLGICASSGSACTSGSLEPSHVIRAMGVPFTMAHGSIRFSLSRFNTEADVDRVLETLPAIVTRLRKISPFSQKG